MRMPRIGLLLIAALALSGTTFGQGGDSSLRGTIADESGAVLPGVTITATSLALISAATAVSDSSGTYRLLNLPPGDYVLESSLSGFATVRQEGIVLRAGVIFDVNVTMTISTVQETVTVTAETPMMEISRPSNILNVQGEFQRDVPIQARGNWSDFLEMTPGVNARPFDDGSGRMVYFGHGTEHFAHVIQIEGMAAAGYTDAQVTYVGMGMDIVGDITVKTGGAEAKDPMGTGIIINVVTKSGGNSFSGSANMDWQSWGPSEIKEGDDSFFGNNALPDGFDPFTSEKANFVSLGVYTPPENPTAGAGTPTAHQVKQADFTLGGPIAQDKAWFFLSYRYSDLAARISRNAQDVVELQRYSGIPLGGRGTTPVYEAFPNTTQSHQPYAKVTMQVNRNHEFSGYYQNDSLENTSNREYDLAPRLTVQTGGNLYGGKLTSVFGTNTTGQFTVSYNDKASFVPLTIQPQFETLPLYIEIHDGFTDNGSTLSGTGRQAALGTPTGSERPAQLLLLRADVTHYLEDMAGSHEVQFGAYIVPDSRYPSTTIRPSQSDGWNTERHVPLDLDNLSLGTRWFYRQRYDIPELLTRDAQDRDFAFYLQDSWKPVDRLTLNLGVRADFVKRHDALEGFDRMSTAAIGPRFGFAYLLTEDGRTVLRGNAGRVHEQMNGRDNVTSYGGGASNGDLNEWDIDGDGVADYTRYDAPANRIPAQSRFSKDLEQPFVDEFIGGVRRQFPGQFAMDVAWVHRQLTKNYALLDVNGYYPDAAGQPFIGFGKVSNEQGVFLQQTNNTWSKMVYNALEITMTKRTSRMQAMLNINRQWQHYTGDWNPNDPARYISPEKFDSNKALNMPRGNNEHNSLPTSAYSPTWRQYSIRGGLTYLLPYEFTMALSFTHNAGPWSGPPSTRLSADDPAVTQYGPARTTNFDLTQAQSNPLANVNRLVGATRGDLQVQAPSVQTVGLKLGKVIELPTGGSFELSANFFNLLDAYNHNQFTYSSANTTYSPNFLQLRSRQNARTITVRGTFRF
jgi:hypothetical protein